MCGICGIIDLSKQGRADPELVRRMSALIRHRGPDGDGFYDAAQVSLGMRRLSIIDVDGSDQPLYNEDHTIAMVFNGESNNFYHTNYQRKENCLSHETYGTPTDTAVGSDDPVEALFGAVGGKRLLLDRDLLIDLACPKCDVRKEVYRPLALVTLKEGKCEKCGALMKTNIVHEVAKGTDLARRTLRQVGVAPYDIVKVETATSGVYARLSKDRSAVMSWS